MDRHRFSVVEVNANELLFIVLDQSQSLLRLFRAKKNPFSLAFSHSILIEQVKLIQTFDCFILNTTLCLIFQTAKEIGYSRILLSETKPSHSIRIIPLLSIVDETPYIAYYFERENVLCFFKDMSFMISEKIDEDVGSTITMNPKKMTLVTDIGNFGNFADLEIERAVLVTGSKLSNNFIVSSQSKMSQLPAIYWMQWDLSQMKVKVCWKRSLYRRVVGAILLPTFDSEEIVIVHNEVFLSILNIDGVIREYSDLDIGLISSINLWEYKNHIVTLLAVTNRHEYYMLQIELSEKFNLQIVQKYDLYSLSPLHSIFQHISVDEVVILSPPPSSSRNTFLFLTINQKYGWDLLTSNSTLKELSYFEIARTVQPLPQIFGSPLLSLNPISVHKNSKSVTSIISDQEFTSALLTLRHGRKLWFSRIAELDLSEEFIPDLRILEIQSIESHQLHSSTHQTPLFYLHLSSQSYRLSTLLQFSWSENQGIHSILPIELEFENFQHSLQIYRIKQSQYFLQVSSSQLVLFSVDSLSCTTVFKFTLNELWQLFVTKGCLEEEANISSLLDRHRAIHSSAYLENDILIIIFPGVLLYLRLNLSDLLNKASFISQIYLRSLSKEIDLHIGIKCLHIQEDKHVQVIPFINQDVAVEVISQIEFPMKILSFQTVRFPDITLGKSEILHLTLLRSLAGINCFDLFLITSKGNLLWVEIIFDFKTFTFEMVHHEPVLIEQEESWRNVQILPMICDNQRRELLIIYDSMSWVQVSILFPSSSNTDTNMNHELSITIRNILHHSLLTTNEGSSPFIPQETLSSIPVYLNSLGSLLWLESSHFSKLPSMYAILTADVDFILEPTIPNDLWVEKAVSFPGQVIAVKQNLTQALIFVIVSFELGDEEEASITYQLRVYNAHSVELQYSCALDSTVCEIMSPSFWNCMITLQLTFCPTHPLQTIDHSIDKLDGEDRSLINPTVYFHLVIETPSIYYEGEDETRDVENSTTGAERLIHTISLGYKPLSRKVVFLNYLYFPLKMAQPFKSLTVSSLSSRSFCLIEDESTGRNLFLFYPSGHLTVLRWEERLVFEEIVHPKKGKINPPLTMIGAYSIKTDVSTLQIKEKKALTRLEMKTHRVSPSEIFRSLQPKREIRDVVPLFREDVIIIVQPLFPSGMLITRLNVAEKWENNNVLEDITLIELPFLREINRIFAFQWSDSTHALSRSSSYVLPICLVYLMEFPVEDENELLIASDSLTISLIVFSITQINREYMTGHTAERKTRGSAELEVGDLCTSPDRATLEINLSKVRTLLKADNDIAAAFAAEIWQRIERFHYYRCQMNTNPTAQSETFEELLTYLQHQDDLLKRFERKDKPLIS